jgi:UDPglucose 6-dehydrogenase
MDETRHLYGDLDGLELCETADDTLIGANALAIVTEWKNFWSPDFTNIADQLTDKAIFDGRNLYDPAAVKSFGLRYFAIGRGEQLN